jgi:hypothetical protein
MKTSAKNPREGKAAKKPAANRQKTEELHTDAPISEKDEIKKAEERLRQIQKKRL